MAKFPEIKCPSCGDSLVPEVGFPNMDALHGYGCGRGGWGCVGFHITVDELADAEKYRIIVEECLQRKARFDAMRERNGWKNQCADGERLPYCLDCHGYHAPTAEHPSCRLCSFGTVHAPAPVDICFRDYKGWNFTPPFHCMCCGKEICFHQWAFGRSCGTCDTGACHKERLHERCDVVFYGNGEMVDPKEAERYRLTPDRMRQIPPGVPAKWFPRKEKLARV
jgi:hypothetical protein